MWYYASDEERKGPVTEQAIQSLYAMKQVSADTLVWQDGMTDWKPLSETELAAVLEIPLPEGDAWQTCAYSGERGQQSAMVPVDGYFILAEHKDSAVDYIKQGGVLPKAELSLRADGNTDLPHLFRFAWALVAQDGLKLSLLYLALWIPGNLLSNWMDIYVFDPEKPKLSLQFYRLLGDLLDPIIAGASFYIFWQRAHGNYGPIQRWLWRGAALWWRLTLIHFITSLMMILGLLLLVIPGLLVVVRTCLADALAVDSRLGSLASVKASWELAKGRFWQITGYFLLVQVLATIPLLAFEGMMILVPQYEEWVSRSLVQSFLALGHVFVPAFTVCYVRELRALKSM